MGLLTDPTAGHGKLTKALLKYYVKICFLLYIGGVVWFCILAYPPFNQETYFSENALLPGLVQTEFHEEKFAKLYHTELMDEMEKYKDSVPYPWLRAKFRQLGLDVYMHNFTLNYPLGKERKYVGKNVYAILRAARASSTEALVLSVPYRPPSSIHQTTAPSIAIMLAFAKFANRQKYWAKDIIFLVTEHEQLGMQAWLEAYHSVSCGKKGVLEHGDLNGRAGAIQAAINLELHSINIGRIDVKIEGLNGQLPNLDLFNLVNRLCIKEHVEHTFKNTYPKIINDPYKSWLEAFKTLMAMISTQATSIPNGNHGLYHRFGIEAVTMEGHAEPLKYPKGNRASFYTIGRILEGIFRSLNNLLERFHQSYFFYLLPASNRFISIGLYMPCISLVIGTLFIKACAHWYQLEDEDSEDEFETESSNTEIEENPPAATENFSKLTDEMWKQRLKQEVETDHENDSEIPNYCHVCLYFVLSHIFGVAAMTLAQNLAKYGLELGYSIDNSIYMGYGVISLLFLTMPLFTFGKTPKAMKVLNILALLELGTLLVCVAMTNFSLALYAAVIYVPFALFIGGTDCW